MRLERLTAGAAAPAARSPQGSPGVIERPRDHSAQRARAGTYRLTLRGSGGGALADVDARALGNDYRWEFTVDGAP